MNYKYKDIRNWPNSWAIIHEDIEYGKKIIKIYRPFIKSLKEKGLSRKTINSYIDDLWVLGGFIIKIINQEKKYRNYEPEWLFPRYIDSCDGPKILDFSEYEQNKFDRTCRKFYTYLVENYLSKEFDNLDDMFERKKNPTIFQFYAIKPH